MPIRVNRALNISGPDEENAVSKMCSIVVPFAVPAVGRVSFHRVHSLMTGQRQMLL